MRFKNIVVGSSLSALMFSYRHQYPIFFSTPKKPFRFDYLSPDSAFTSIPKFEQKLVTFEAEIKVGAPKQFLWDRLYFSLSLNGLIPLSNLCKKIRCINNQLVCSDEYSKICELEFDTCHYFGDDNAEGFINENKLDDDSYICYDYIAFNSGGKHEIDYIDTSDNFVSKIWFYSSDRIDGNTPVKDACAVSTLTREQLLDFDYSETMARFKVLKIMKDNGMRGKLSGYTKKGTPRHYDFRTTSIRRETSRIRNRLTPANSSIKIEADCEESLLGLLQDVHNPCSAVLEALNVTAS